MPDRRSERQPRHWAGCNVGADGRLRLAPQAARQLQFDADGLSALIVDDQLHSVRADGSSLPVIARDNGPDDFTEGLPRGIFRGRLGLYDLQLREMIAPH
jgi:hypothetical protein